MKKKTEQNEVVLQKTGTPCIIDNGVNLHSMYILENLFDNGHYVEREISAGNFEVLGYVGGAGVIVRYKLNTSEMTIKTIQPMTAKLIKSYREILPSLLIDEQIWAEIFPNEAAGEYKVCFFWKLYD